MGVPKFYRWISERYPQINQIVTDNALLPEFDHLYLDMNGIIHGCTHPPDLDLSTTVLSERDMMMGIMHYLDRIITQIVKPQVSVYMAIDGVAPRAKLNQQRSRRYRSARDMAEAMKEANAAAAATASGDNNDSPQPKKEMFDSNCITPGTEFLQRVSNVIEYWIRQKLKEDPAWKNLTVIFSGHDIPGEGEHKIMNHIRQMRSMMVNNNTGTATTTADQTLYQPNTRHCIYGQDADLIMLGLVTHEPHFTILREVVDFNSFARQRSSENSLKEVKKFTKESDFQLLHLSVLREYLSLEFCLVVDPTSSSTQLQFDLERCIDDFVFMTFLVGNDFLPHLPALDIGDGAFDMLFAIYKEQRLTWTPANETEHELGCYLTYQGEISDPRRLEAFIAAVGAQESDILAQKKKDDALYIKKKRKWDKRDGKGDTQPSDAELQAMEATKQGDYQSAIHAMMAKQQQQQQHGSGGSDTTTEFVAGWQPDIALANLEEDHKGRYYFEKLGFLPIDKEAHWQLTKSYMEGLMWCLAYYYKGCISWGWFYPYHYGPMLSDMANIPQMFDEITFDIGQPLTPFQQLMACLPPGSSDLVPKLYRSLMTMPTSPILRFYPQEFEVDMNGKKNPWEGVNLLPFIDVTMLKETIATHCPDSKLSAAERKRNAFGTVRAFRHDPSCVDTTIDSPDKSIGLMDIVACCSSATVLDEPPTPHPPFQPILLPGTKIPFPGFPSLNVIPMASVEHVSIGLNCFGSPSKYPTCLLTLNQMPELPPLNVLAGTLLGRSLFVNWPMMHEARVVAISDEVQEIRLSNKFSGDQRVKPHGEQWERWRTETDTMQQMYYVGNGVPGSGGVNIGPILIRLKVLPLQGMRTNLMNGSTKKLFGREEADVPLQLALWQAPAPDPRFQERGPMTLQDRLPVGSSVILTKGKYRGCLGQVVGLVDKKTVGVKVQTLPAEIPFGLALARTVQESYISSNDAARILKIHPGLLGKIAGRLNFEQNRYDLGLNLKSPDGMCVVGYTRKKVEKLKPNRGGGNNNNNGNSRKADAWSAGDTLRVVGSKREDGYYEDRIVWEYTPKAIRLIEAYRSKFPQLFAGIAKLPNEKKYDANVIFGPNGESWLPVIREWLNDLDSAKLPRSPVSTQSMSYDAVAAVEKAAAVRVLALKKRGYPKESIIKIPGSALYRQGSTGATNVLLASDLNNGDSPQLGDRIVNLAVDGIPFGMRGTVVSIHEAATTGSVEVVMDNEFIGGSTLQGLCTKFRGKLCLWSLLLKIAPDDTKNLVDKLVPKGGNKTAAVDKIISSIDPSAKHEANRTRQQQQQQQPQQLLQRQQQQQQRQQQQQATTSNPRSKKSPPPEGKPPPPEAATAPKPPPAPPTSSAPAPTAAATAKPRAASSGRATSAQKSRQGGWREARGPEENGTGFKWKGKRKGKTGVAEWRNRMAENQALAAADLLKSTLGISQHSTTGTATAKTTAPATSTPASSSVGSAAQQLKAVLGVERPPEPQDSSSSKRAASAPTPRPAAAPSSMATNMAELKTALGVGQAQPTTPQQPFLPPPPPQQQAAQQQQQQAPAPPVPETAADKLLQMMATSQRPNMPPMPPAVTMPHSSGFNFTYVDEGSAGAPMHPPPHGPPVPSSFVPPVPLPMQMPPHPGAMPAPPHPMIHPGMVTSNGYPPLGSNNNNTVLVPPPNNAGATEPQQDGGRPNRSSSGGQPSTEFSIVPSAVVRH